MSSIGIVAIHGGNIEPGTAEIARAISGDKFKFLLNEQGPHISSTEFTNDKLENFLKEVDIVVSIHGEKSVTGAFTMLGGLHKELITSISEALNKSGFVTKIPPEDLSGDNPKNVCNRGKTGEGLQLEISRKLRDELMANASLLQSYSSVIRNLLINF